MSDEKVQVNTEMSADLVEKLDAMSEADFNTRQQFIRKLITQEWGRRQQMSLPLSGTGTTGKSRKATPATAA